MNDWQENDGNEKNRIGKRQVNDISGIIDMVDLLFQVAFSGSYWVRAGRQFFGVASFAPSDKV